MSRVDLLHNAELKLPVDVVPHGDEIRYMHGVVDMTDEAIHAFWSPGEDDFDEGGMLPPEKLIEAAAQSAAYSLMYEPQKKPVMPVFSGLKEVVISDDVEFGEAVQMRVEVGSDEDNNEFTGAAIVTAGDDDREILRAQIIGSSVKAKMLAWMLRKAGENIDDSFATPTLSETLEVIEDRLGFSGEGLKLDGIVGYEDFMAQGFWLPSVETEFAGHFPDMPVLPGIKQLIAMRQLGEHMLLGNTHGDSNPVLVGIHNVDFKAPVVPGMGIIIEANFDKLEPTDKQMIASAETRTDEVSVRTSAELTWELRT